LSRGFPRHVVSLGREMLSDTAARYPRFGEKLRGIRSFSQAVASRIRDVGAGATARQSLRRAMRSIASEDEVLLFEFPEAQGLDDPPTQLVPLTREHLVEASILNSGDADTLRYLMRCAHRLAKPGATGFVLQDETGKPIHFLWIANYDGFHLSEINHALAPSSPSAGSPSAAMIFDCWTPAAGRGSGHYANAIRQAAAKLRRERKAAWIFSGAGNAYSWRGILKAGFEYRFSLIRRSRFGRAMVTRCDTTTAIPPRRELHSSATVLEKAG